MERVKRVKKRLCRVSNRDTNDASRQAQVAGKADKGKEEAAKEQSVCAGKEERCWQQQNNKGDAVENK